MLSTEDVRKALGLAPFEGFARKKLNNPEKNLASEMVDASKEIHVFPRLTGRSTRMICSMLAAISAGRRVSIYAKPQAMEYALKEHAQAWAERLGLNPKLILGHLASTAEIEFFDHTWYDAL